MLAELDATRRDELVEQIAARIRSARMESPALFLLAWHRPFAFIGGQLLLGLQPFLSPMLGETSARELAFFFEREENIEKLITRLEEVNA